MLCSKPTLKDYSDFAESIGFSSTKVNGVFKYVNKETGSILTPYELGCLFRLNANTYIEGLKKATSQIEYYCIENNKHGKLEDLPKLVATEIKNMKNYIQSQENKLK